MKKSGFFNKITIIDILIIICIIGAIGFAVYHMVDDDSSKASATSFDYSTNAKILETYLNYYHNGNKVTSTIVGTDSNTGEQVKINGDVLWLGESEKDKVNVLIDNNGKKMLAGFYKDVPNADIFIEQISLESDGDQYANVTDISVSPKNIRNIDELISGIPDETEYEISTAIAIDNLDNVKYQKLLNALNNNKKPSMVLGMGQNNILEINKARSNDFEIANKVLGEFNGETSQIQIRIYNCTPEDIKAIESSYNVLKIAKVSQ